MSISDVMLKPKDLVSAHFQEQEFRRKRCADTLVESEHLPVV